MAAFHAYKFTHFYEAKEGISAKKPDEFGTLEKASALLFGIKSYKKKIDTQHSFLFDTIFLKPDDSLRLEAWQSRDSGFPKGTVILFHGHGGNKAGVINEAYAFNKLGYRVFLVDFRAHGNSQGNVCTIGYDEAKDVKAAYDYVAAKGEKNIILYGISLGAAAEMKAVKDYYLKPSKMILEMPFGSLHEAVKARCRILGVPQQPIAALLTFWGGAEQGFWAFDHNPEDYAKSIDCGVLLQLGKNDERVTKTETETIYNNLRSTKKSLVIYENSGHQSLCANETDKWIKTVSEFLSN
jgi:alpha-beta hydrolase superfamily lysophospholipase